MIRPDVRAAIVAHARTCAPEEACGLIAGVGNEIRMVYPLTNARRSPVSFLIEPAEHFGALRHAERNGWELIGAFHSHPSTEAVPSAVDAREAGEPDWLYLVLGAVGEPRLRGWRIRPSGVEEVPLIEWPEEA